MPALLLAVFSTLLSSADRTVLLSTAKTIDTDDGERAYYQGPIPEQTKRIVIALHGYKDNPKQMAYYSGLHNALPEGTLTVYAKATQSEEYAAGWNGKICCGNGLFRDIDDTQFIAGLISQLRAEYGSSDTPVYLIGFSNGAMFAQYVAGQYPELISGVISHAGTLGGDGEIISLSEPVPILLMHGEQDTNVNFSGSKDTEDDFDGWFSHQKTKEIWEKNNMDKAAVDTRTYPELTHQWPDWRIARPWHHRPEGSQHVAKFIESIEISSN